jgi:hypothetical protein
MKPLLTLRIPIRRVRVIAAVIIETFDARDIVYGTGPADACEVCGADRGHEWCCPVAVEEAARHIVKRSNPVIKRTLPGAHLGCDDAIAEYTRLYGEGSSQVRHWKMVQEEMNQVEGIR